MTDIVELKRALLELLVSRDPEYRNGQNMIGRSYQPGDLEHGLGCRFDDATRSSAARALRELIEVGELVSREGGTGLDAWVRISPTGERAHAAGKYTQVAGVTGDSPSRIGKWVVERKIGRGGQADAHVVSDPGAESPARHVAKVLRPWTPRSKSETAEAHLGRFRREVATLRNLAETGCPGIVRVVDAELRPPDAGRPWYVMPFYEGGALASTDVDGNTAYAEKFEGNVERVLAIAASLARTLAWMHEHEPVCVHRDVHMGNVFLQRRGGPPILGDFGLVHVSDEPTGGGTAPAEPLGPWRWRPKELRPGSPQKHDPRSDVYMLGGIIYEALSGGGYLEETEFEGRFTHEAPDRTLNKYTSDPRIDLVSRLLRRMLCEDIEGRVTAAEAAQACDDISNWTSGDSLPAALRGVGDLVRAAVAPFRQRKQARDRVAGSARRIAGRMLAHMKEVHAALQGATEGELVFNESTREAFDDFYQGAEPGGWRTINGSSILLRYGGNDVSLSIQCGLRATEDSSAVLTANVQASVRGEGGRRLRLTAWRGSVPVKLGLPEADRSADKLMRDLSEHLGPSLRDYDEHVSNHR